MELPTGKCDQTFHDKLYVGDAVTFYDKYTNGNTFSHTLVGFNVDFRESDDMNKDGKATFAENFDWALPYKAGSQIAPGTKDARIVEAKTAYRILKAPTVRKPDNIAIDYTVAISTPNGQSSHKECITYEVSWCGDGVVDAGNKETCDPAAPGQSPDTCNPAGTYDKDGKDISCQPITTKPATSTGITIKKYAGDVNGNYKQDGQVAGDAFSALPGEDYTYTYDVKVTGQSVEHNPTITDTFPIGVSVTGFKSKTPGWNCNNGTKTVDGKIYHTVICKADAMNPGSNATIIVNVKLAEDLESVGVSPEGLSKGMRNIAYVCSVETNPDKTKCDTTCTDVYNPTCTPQPPKECSTIPTAPNFDPACVVAPEFKIKKYANNQDAQTSTDAVQVGSETFTYSLDVENIGGTGGIAFVRDNFPQEIQIIEVQKNDAWNCNVEGNLVTCTSKSIIINGTKAPRINITAKIKSGIPASKIIRNVSGVCAIDPKNPDKKCEPKEPICKPGDIDYNPTTRKCDVVDVFGGEELDLSIKKYVDSNDAQPGSPVTKTTNATFNYVIKVKVETGTSTGITTVKDILPAGIELNGQPSGEGWTFAPNSGKTIIATSTQTVTAGSYFTDIIVPVKVTAGEGQTIRNDATVHNPNEKPNSCYNDNKLPNGDEKNCEKDPKNTDPAVITTPNPPAKPNYIAGMCVDSTTPGVPPTTTKKTFTSLEACNAEMRNIFSNNPLKKTACEEDNSTNRSQIDTKLQIMIDTKICEGVTPPPPGICGDGKKDAGEKCDDGLN